MIVITNRHELREFLNNAKLRAEKRMKLLKTKAGTEFERGVIAGLNDALYGLDEWEKQIDSE